MRLTTPLKTVLAGSAALALLTACGGGSDDSSSSSSSSSSSAASTSSSAAETSAELDADAAAFCSDAQSAFDDFESAFANAGSDVSAIPELLSQASQRLQSIEPPAEISAPWTSFTGALDTAATGIQGVDLTTPEGQQQLATIFGQLQTSVATDQATLQQYLSSTCGIDPEGAGTAAPTS